MFKLTDHVNLIHNKNTSILISITPLIILLLMLFLNILIYKDSSTSGPNQIALFLSAFIAIAIGVRFLKIEYNYIEGKIIQSISMAMQACLILLSVGILIGAWILCGTVPVMIYYGLKLINPTVFLGVSCICCCIVSLATGSSWTAIGTVGLALIGIGKTLGINEGLVAGSIISGAYFGDKMSPLSDTTNLAPAMANTDVFTHVRHMVYTSGPAIIIAILLYFIISFMYKTEQISIEELNSVLNTLSNNFNINIFLLIPPLFVIFLILKKVPALPAILLGAFCGLVFAFLFQYQLLSRLTENDGRLGFIGAFKIVISTCFEGVNINTGNKLIDELLSRGGMKSMLNTVWLILMAMVFGGALEGTGMLHSIANTILKFVRNASQLIWATLISCLFFNIAACDQYMSIVVPGRMFKKAYEKQGLHPKNLSRALEDAGTVTSVLIPWNTCGAFNSAILGVATLVYAPFCFFNLLSPIISAILAGLNITITRINKDNN